jgi:hypothetical protein
MTTCRNKFVLHPANDFIWNYDELLKFLIHNQGQPIAIDTNTEGVCLHTAGVYTLLQDFDFADVNIYTSNLLEQHDQYQIFMQKSLQFFKVKHTNYSEYHHWNKNRIFAGLYNRPLWYRLGLAAEMQVNYQDQSVINLRANPHDPDQNMLFEVQKLFENAPGSFAKFAQVMHTWPKQIEQQDGYTKGNNTTGHTDQLMQFYSDFLIDIVAETWTQGNCFNPSEKTVRPMLLKKPMIIMGPINYLEYLRQMGFRTFHDFWDEDYDGYSGADRYSKILKLMHQLSQMSVTQLESMYWDMQYTLDHNYNLLASQTYNHSVTHVV